MSGRKGRQGDDEVASEISRLGHPHVTCRLAFLRQKNNFTFFFSFVSYLSASFGFFTDCAPWVLCLSYFLFSGGLFFSLSPLFLFPWAPRFLPCPSLSSPPLPVLRRPPT